MIGPARARSLAAPLSVLVVVIAVWQLVVQVAHLPSHLLPSPAAVALRIYQGVVGGVLLHNLFWTLGVALVGYLLATAGALVLAALLSEVPVLEALTFPAISGFQAIPKVALAPLILIWAGFGGLSEVILVALITFFPIFSSALIGFKSVDHRLVDLFRICHGGQVFKFVHLSLPAAAAQIFAGLQVSIGFALVGCVVVEFLVGTGGLGFVIQNSANTLDTATAVAAMIVLAVAGALIGVALRAVRRRIVFWEAVPSAAAFSTKVA